MSFLRRLAVPLLATALSGSLPVALALPATPAAAHPKVDVVGLGVADHGRLLHARRVTSVDLVGEYLRRIDAHENAYADQPGLNAVITVNPRARTDAARLDRETAPRPGAGSPARDPVGGQGQHGHPRSQIAVR